MCCLYFSTDNVRRRAIYVIALKLIDLRFENGDIKTFDDISTNTMKFVNYDFRTK